MSATQELIAAALTAADELDELSRPMHSRMSPHAAALRDACARAMVQPAPDMAEVERLLDLYADHVFSDGLLGSKVMTEHAATARSALLDYVRGVLAERDALMLEFCPQEMTEVQKEKWARNQQPVSTAEVPMPPKCHPLHKLGQPDMVPEGWQLVPKEPTDSMLRAIRRQRSGGRIGVGDRADWSAWLAAAPDHFRDAAEMVSAAPQPCAGR